MAKDQEWKTNSTTIENGRIKVSSKNKYVKDGTNKLTTFTADNISGRVPLDADSSNGIVKTTFYTIDSDGYIDFYRQRPNGTFKKYESIQEIADAGILGYNAKTTNLIKTALQGNLEEAASEANIPGAANPNADANNDGDTSDDGDDADEGGSDDDGDDNGDGDDEPSQSKPINLSIPGKPNEPSGTFRYPTALGSKSAANLDRIKFTQGKYSGVEIGGTGDNALQNNNLRRNLDEGFKEYNNSSVTIGIQPSINDSTAVKWNGSNLNQLQSLAASASVDIAFSENPDEAVTKIKNIAKGIVGSGNNDDVANALRVYFGAKAAGLDGGALLSRATGAVLNPNLELLFEGPDLRQFNYTFKMSASNQFEASQIKSIIKWFKKGMAIRRASGQLFLATPNVFRLKYIKGEGNDNPHDGLNLIKDCALLNCQVNYTPEGNYSTFTDGTMTMYELTLSFGELNPIMAEDYDNHPIGY